MHAITAPNRLCLLEAEWLFSTAHNPSLVLRAAEPIAAFSGELSFAGELTDMLAKNEKDPKGAPAVAKKDPQDAGAAVDVEAAASGACEENKVEDSTVAENLTGKESEKRGLESLFEDEDDDEVEKVLEPVKKSARLDEDKEMVEVAEDASEPVGKRARLHDDSLFQFDLTQQGIEVTRLGHKRRLRKFCVATWLDSQLCQLDRTALAGARSQVIELEHEVGAPEVCSIPGGTLGNQGSVPWNPSKSTRVIPLIEGGLGDVTTLGNYMKSHGQITHIEAEAS